MYYLIDNGKIIASASDKLGENWVQSDKEYTYSTAQNEFVLEEDIDTEAEENAMAKEKVEEQIAQLKAELSAYDYIGVKIAMGVATVEEYAEQIAYTQSLRARINELQG